MSAIDSFRLNARTQKLHVRTFTPVGQPKAVLVWHHGKNLSLWRQRQHIVV